MLNIVQANIARKRYHGNMKTPSSSIYRLSSAKCTLAIDTDLTKGRKKYA